ncbi:AAA family ATPase [bacterium]|nr:AAA family ATPase [bacterium]
MPEPDWERAVSIARALEASVRRVILGKDDRVRLALLALFARGHLLIEDVPGTGKTLLARAIARSLDARFTRIQFTPDLLPSDVTGVSVFNPKDLVFEFREGPVFTEVLLADEINRATPRAQSALLESMEERTVTADGVVRPLPDLFFVVATQNPIEQQGTFPLPEAQLDRFALRVDMGYPSVSMLVEVLGAQQVRHPLEDLRPVASSKDLSHVQATVRSVSLEVSLRRYVAELVEATRGRRDVLLGASPRAAIWLARAAQARAFLEGRRFAIPEDVKGVAHAALDHRLIIEPRARLAGLSAARVTDDVLEKVLVPISIAGVPPPGP